MARLLRQLQEEIRALSTTENEALLRVLLDDLDEPADPLFDAAWLEEAQRRSREIDGGAVSGIPGDEVLRRLDASLRK